MGNIYLCQCTHRRCCDVIDPHTGQRGVSLDSKAFRRHQQDEKNAAHSALQVRAQDAQKAAIAAQERRLEDALSNMDLGQRPPEVASEPRYSFDFKKKLVADISAWQDQITTLRSDLQLFVVPQPGQSAESEFLSSVQLIQSECTTARMSLGRLQHRIKIAGAGKFRKDAAVKILLNEAQHDLISAEEEIQSLEHKCQHVLHHHDEIQKAILKGGGSVVDTSHHFTSPFARAHTIIQLVSLTVVVCHLLFGLSRRGCAWIYAMCAVIIETTLDLVGVSTQMKDSPLGNILHNFPKDVRSAVDSFHLEAKCTIYAVCPRCDETYKPSFDGDIAKYPERCNSSRHNNRCGEIITRPKAIGIHQAFVPIKPYVIYDVIDWLAGLTSRQGYEKMMDCAWDRMNSTSNGRMDDIFQGSVIRSFKGPDGVTHFSLCGPDDSTGRYLFSMAFDFFNPLRNIANGKRVCVGVVALMVLNLPISLRYKPENVLLAGIIPGPKEPSLDAINPYIKPFVEAFLLLWKGVRFSRTSLFQGGRWIIAALVLIVCDIPAARKIGGFASHSHEFFCSVCWANKTINGFGDWHYHFWPRRTNESCRAWAACFKEAATKKASDSYFDRSGIRYSVLMELPYFDPPTHLVVDPMHNLFLGLAKEQFQSILGFCPKGQSNTHTNDVQPASYLRIRIMPSNTNPIPLDTSSRRGIRNIYSRLGPPLPENINNIDMQASIALKWSKYTTKPALVYVAKGLNLVPQTLAINGSDPQFPGRNLLKKTELYAKIIQWRAQQPPPSFQSPINEDAGRVFNEDEVQELWKDIKNMIKPSWATIIPDNISSVSAKLKSDQWRSIASLYLPVTLIRIWSNEPETCPRSRRQLLHLTMLLCSAICIITSRSISETQITLFMNHMAAYRAELDRLFPGYQLHANHHMAMHLGEFLTFYGPVHGWWTFPLERIIGTLQRIHTNYKPGEYESTIGRSWSRSASFRAIFLKDTLPRPVRLCAEIFHKYMKPQNHNNLEIGVGSILGVELHDDDTDSTRYGDSHEGKKTAIPIKLQDAMRVSQPGISVPRLAITKNRLMVRGICFATCDIHEGNSGILCNGSNIPRSIISILEVCDGDPNGTEKYWFVVKRYRQANVSTDPYAAYPHVRAKLWSTDLEDDIEVVPLSSVETHFAKCNMLWEEKEVCVVISLSKTQLD